MRPSDRPEPGAPLSNRHPQRDSERRVHTPRLKQALTPAVLATAVGLVAVACGAPAGTPTALPSAAPSEAPPAAASGLLIEVTTEGGFINPAANIGALPALVVDTDGRIYTPALDAPPALAPAVTVRDMGPAGAAAIVAVIRSAGLDAEGSGGIAADTGTTVFTVDLGGSEIVSRFASGGPGAIGGPGGPGGPAVSPDPAAPGAAAFDLLARLADPAVAWAGSTGSPVPYVPVGYRISVAPSAETGATTLPWPQAEAPERFGSPAVVDLEVDGLRSGIVLAADAGPLAPILAAAPGTLVTSGAQAWTIRIRPLYPYELGS